MMTFRIFGLLVAGLIASSPAANAAVIYSNLGASDSFNLGSVRMGPGYAYQFTAGATAYATSVDAPIVADGASAVTVTMRLYSDSGSNAVGTLLETFQLTSDVAPANLVTASMSGSTLLTSGNKYWLEVAAPPSGLSWYNSGTAFGTYGFFNGEGYGYSYYSDQQMAAFRINGLPTGDSAPPQVSNVSATPDPQTFNGDVLISADVTDQTGVASVEYTLDGGSNWTAMAAVSGDTYTATLDAPLVGEYTACVRATDTADPANTSDGTACETFDVTAAQLDIAFAGQELDLDGGETQLKAAVTGPCSSGAEVEFFVDGVSQGKVSTDIQGMASLSKTLLMGVHDIKVEVDDQDLGGDTEPECQGDSDTGVTVVADPNAASSGGGWYKVDSVAPPRVNFGYVANVKYNKKTQESVTTGNLLWMNQDNFKLKGTIKESGKFTCPTTDYVQCAVFGGTGILYEHNDSYDPMVDPPEEEWTGNSPLEVSFVATVYDGGSSTVCQKKRCTVTERPDAIMMQIHGASVPAAPYEIITLQGGSITVKK